MKKHLILLGVIRVDVYKDEKKAFWVEETLYAKMLQ